MRTTSLIALLVYAIATVDASTTCGSVKRAYQSSGCCNESDSQVIALVPAEPCPSEAITASASYTTLISNDTIPFIVNRMTTRLGAAMTAELASMILSIAPLLQPACVNVPQKFVDQLSAIFGALFGPPFEMLLQYYVGSYAIAIPFEILEETTDLRRKLSRRATVDNTWKKSVKKMLVVIRRLKRRARTGRSLQGDDDDMFESLPTCSSLEDAYYEAQEDNEDDEEGEDADIFATILELMMPTLTPSEVSNNCAMELFAALDDRRLSEVTSPSSNLTVPNCRCEEPDDLISMSRVPSAQQYKTYLFADSSIVGEDFEVLDVMDPMLMLADHVNMTVYYAASSAQLAPAISAAYTAAGFSVATGPSPCAALAQSSVLGA